TLALRTEAHDEGGGTPHSSEDDECDGEYTPKDHGEATRLVSEDSADEMVRMLESVVANDEGTGVNGRIEGYRVAGKTGTAEIPGANGQRSDVAGACVGTPPADDTAVSPARSRPPSWASPPRTTRH